LVAEAKCRAATRGERWTEQRSVVVRILAASGQHQGANDIYLAARIHDPHIGLATVYRTLGLLVTLGIAKRPVQGSRYARYELSFGRTRHGHLLDADTGSMVEFTDPELDRLHNTIARRLGYRIIEHRLVLIGRRAEA